MPETFDIDFVDDPPSAPALAPTTDAGYDVDFEDAEQAPTRPADAGYDVDIEDESPPPPQSMVVFHPVPPEPQPASGEADNPFAGFDQAGVAPDPRPTKSKRSK